MKISRQSFIKLVAKMLPSYISFSVREYIACQFALESSFGDSVFAVSMHNYCGMRVPVTRFTTAVNFNDKGKFAKYRSLGDCVSDYLLYLCALRYRFDELQDVSKFRIALDFKGYCPDLGYLEKIDSIYRQYCDLNFKS